MPDNPSWKFRELQRNEPNIDPVTSEFFTTEALSSLAEALIRETIQNSLDASLEKGPVVVRIDTSGLLSPLTGDDTNFYLNNLSHHLKAKGTGLRNPPEDYRELNFILIEDFGTKGLTGDPLQHKDESETTGEKNNFYYFWRNVGRSGKSEKDRGRWGIGKTVFPASSRINSFWGLTVRADDGHRFLMGQSVLKTHSIRTSRYFPYGYFAMFDHKDQFQLPITERDVLDNFKKHFGLKRTNETGLSVVIPFPKAEITGQELIRSAIMQFFYPILSGELVIELSRGSGVIKIAHETIREAATKVSWDSSGTRLEELLNLFNFVSKAIVLDKKDFVQLTLAGNSAAWKSDMIPADLTPTLRKEFEEGKFLAFQVPLMIEKIGEKPRQTFFRVFLQKDSTLTSGEAHFIREGLTIPEVARSTPKFVRGLVIIDDTPLCNFLGDAENPAHTDWRPRSSKLSDKYKRSESVVRLVRNSVTELTQYLAHPPEKRDVNLLKDLFYVELPSEQSENQGGIGPRDEKGYPPTEKPEISSDGSFPFRISRITGGFTLKPGKSLNGFNEKFSLEVAYQGRRGNAFKKYHPADFNLQKNPIEVKTRNVEIIMMENNILQFAPRSAECEITVVGFDTRRDLRIRVDRIREEL